MKNNEYRPNRSMRVSLPHFRARHGPALSSNP
jgi:hypothetical protein